MGAAWTDASAAFNLNWQTLSAVVGLTFWSFYFRLYPGSVKSPQVVDFLKALVRHIRQPLLIVWNRLPAHRSRLVGDDIEGLDGRVDMVCLLRYAPELNPVEYVWGYWKQHETADVCPKDYWQLSEVVRRTLRRMWRRPRLITTFRKQASLWPE